MRLAGKMPVATGSTKGIGLAIARAFVREGARVVVHGRSPDDCAAVARQVGAAAVPIQTFGGTIDILVNNAGQPRVAPSVELSEADYRYTLDLNLTAYFLLSQELGPEHARGSSRSLGIAQTREHVNSAAQHHAGRVRSVGRVNG